MKTKHFYIFNTDIAQKMKSGKLDINGWEILRTADQENNFSIEKTREKYVKSCEDSSDYRKVAEKISDLINVSGWTNIASMGVGKGILEYHIKKIAPYVNIRCTDYTQHSLELLKKVLTECNDFHIFDMLNDDWNSLKEMDVVIMFRLSTEFSSKQWYDIFDKMYTAGVKNVLYIPTELLNVKILLNEKIGWLSCFIRRNRATFCGWMYSEKEFKKFFSGKSNKKLYLTRNTYKLENYTIYELIRN